MLTIVVPLASPMILTATIIVMVGKWNEYVWPLIVTSTADMRTLPIGLLFLRSQEGYSNWGVIMAGAVFVSLPMLIIFFLAQKRIIGDRKSTRLNFSHVAISYAVFCLKKKI